MRVYKLDSNNFYIGFTELTEENKNTLNHTTKQMTIGYVKPKFDFDLYEWVEGATEQEIKEWEEANKPPIQEEDKITILLLNGYTEVNKPYIKDNNLYGIIENTGNSIIAILPVKPNVDIDHKVLINGNIYNIYINTKGELTTNITERYIDLSIEIR